MLPVEPDRGLILYGILDIAFAIAYLYLANVVVPSRSPVVNLVVYALCAILVASGVALILRKKWSRYVGLAAAGCGLAFTISIITALIMSSAYLSGVYGGFGKGAATICLMAAALAVEVFGLLPAFQLRFLLRPEVRRRLDGDPPPAEPAAPPEKNAA